MPQLVGRSRSESHSGGEASSEAVKAGMTSRTLGLVNMAMGLPVRSKLEESWTDVSGSGFLNEVRDWVSTGRMKLEEAILPSGL